ncbi:hypothetical protein SRABI84_01355 [Peribacillus simplex]|nr:hypothetical protein SRABI84_01355 [Peribacillus simplex]
MEFTYKKNEKQTEIAFNLNRTIIIKRRHSITSIF